jgi:hypothetical protein
VTTTIQQKETTMKTTASLSVLAGAWLIMAAGQAEAHGGPHREYSYRPHHHAHYDYRVRRHHAMPRWLKRHKGFRRWYRHSRYERNRRLGWDVLWDIYTWERRYGRRYDVVVDVYDGHRGWKRKHRRRYRH